MSEPHWIDVATPDVHLRALSWGPEDAPIALCLHGFPDTAHGWRKVAPHLVAAGWRVVAPFMRGYAPSSTSASIGSYHVGALMDDALRVLEAVGPTGRDVLIGHAGVRSPPPAWRRCPTARSRRPSSCWYRPPTIFGHWAESPTPEGLFAQLPRQLLRVVVHHVLPIAPACQSIPRRSWCRDYGGNDDRRTTPKQDVALVRAAIGAPGAGARHRGTTGRPSGQAAAAAVTPSCTGTGCRLCRCRRSTCMAADDGCMSADYLKWVEPALPADSRAEIVEHAGHFMQLDRPDDVARLITEFIGRGNPASQPWLISD